MVKEYNTSKQAQTGAVGPSMPKGAPPVPTFLPAKTPIPSPGSTSIAPSPLPPRAGGDLTRRVADAQDYAPQIARNRMQQAQAQAQAQQPQARAPQARTPMGTTFGPAGRAQPQQPQQQPGLAQQLASLRYGAAAPGLQQQSTAETLSAGLPAAMTTPISLGGAQKPGGFLDAELEEAKEGLVFNPDDPTELQGAWVTDENGDLQWQSADEVKSGLKEAELFGDLQGGAQQLLEQKTAQSYSAGKAKISEGQTYLTGDEYDAIVFEEGEVPAEEGMIWDKNSSTGDWEQRPMTEYESFQKKLDDAANETASDAQLETQLEAYGNQMRRFAQEQMYMAAGQMSAAGLTGGGLGTRRYMQIQSAVAAEMSAKVSDMLMDHWKTKQNAKLQILSTQTSLWASYETMRIQAQNDAYEAGMTGMTAFEDFLDANGLGDHMEAYQKAVSNCNEQPAMEAVKCVQGLYGQFRVDHEGKLAWGIESEEEQNKAKEYAKLKKLKKDAKCNWYDFICKLKDAGDWDTDEVKAAEKAAEDYDKS